MYFGTGSLAAQNLTARPAITAHLESGSEVVILEGVAELVSDRAVVERMVSLYNEKYHWNLDPKQLPGPFYAVRLTKAFGWSFEESEVTPESTAFELGCVLIPARFAGPVSAQKRTRRAEADPYWFLGRQIRRLAALA